MTRTIRYAVLSTALALAAAIPAAAAQPSGSIVSIDRSARTLTVRDRQSGETFCVRIPENAQVSISALASRGSAVNFEQVLVGMQYRGTR